MEPRGLLTQLSDKLLQKPQLIWIYVVVLALFPLTDWLSLALIALVTMRLGWYEGVRCFLAGATASMCLTEYSGESIEAFVTILPTYVFTYAGACLLRKYGNWHYVIAGILSAIFLILLGVHWFIPDFFVSQYQAFLSVLEQIDPDKLYIPQLLGNNPANQIKLAYYMFSVKLLGIFLSVMISLLLARSIQSQLFYPGGFKIELLSFRANKTGLLFLAVIGAGIYQHNVLAYCSLFICFTYFLIGGLSLAASILAHKQKIVIYTAIFLPLIIVPYITLPLYAVFGSIDSIFNLRKRLLLAKGQVNAKKELKG